LIMKTSTYLICGSALALGLGIPAKPAQAQAVCETNGTDAILGTTSTGAGAFACTGAGAFLTVLAEGSVALSQTSMAAQQDRVSAGAAGAERQIDAISRGPKVRPSVEDNINEIRLLLDTLTKQVAAMEKRLTQMDEREEKASQLLQSLGSRLRAPSGMSVGSMIDQIYEVTVRR
jgi:hypothetical protein